MTDDEAGADLRALQDELRGRGIRTLVAAFVDLHGLPKGKLVPLERLPEWAAGAERHTAFSMEGFGSWQETDEATALPDLSRLSRLPWEPDRAWAPADLMVEGKPFPMSSRVVLKAVLAEAEAMGFACDLGIECEVSLLRRGADGALEPPQAGGLELPCYDLGGLRAGRSWLDGVAGAIRELGWGLEAVSHESGQSQFEFNIRYADALTACDRLILFRTMIKHYAEEEGLVATTMPKPFADAAGNGAHFNLSLRRLATGENAFAGRSGEDPHGLGLGETGIHFLGGVLRHGRGLCAAFAPTVNSYKRLSSVNGTSIHGPAPTFNSYGGNARINALRVPTGGGRLENRIPDGAVNPYLAAALMLAAGLEGVRERIDPGPPNADDLGALDPAERRRRGIAPLPQTLREAVEAFSADPLVGRTLGPALRGAFVRAKSREWAEYHHAVGAWETARYGRMF